MAYFAHIGGFIFGLRRGQAVRGASERQRRGIARAPAITLVAFLLWAVLSFLTLFVLFTQRPGRAGAAVPARARGAGDGGVRGARAPLSRAAPPRRRPVRRRRRSALVRCSCSSSRARRGAARGLARPARVASAARASGRRRPGPAPLEASGPRRRRSRSAWRDPHDAVRLHFKHPPRAGLLFDVDTGRVLWRHHATRQLPIASLTKMMTALVATDRIPQGGKVRITAKALALPGLRRSACCRGQVIGISTMLHGLLLPSGNDAARAIARARAAGRSPAS